MQSLAPSYGKQLSQELLVGRWQRFLLAQPATTTCCITTTHTTLILGRSVAIQHSFYPSRPLPVGACHIVNVDNIGPIDIHERGIALGNPVLLNRVGTAPRKSTRAHVGRAGAWHAMVACSHTRSRNGVTGSTMFACRDAASSWLPRPCSNLEQIIKAPI